MKKQNIPIGLANLASIRDDDCYYVDKTPHIDRLITQGRFFFLSRPRRFGKSLLLDTMLELFEGNERLFRGLHIHDSWNWKTHHPVIRLSFGGSGFDEPGLLESNVKSQLKRMEIKHDLPETYTTSDISEPDRFGNLLYHIHETTGKQVVVLVDEYDKPILDAIDNYDLAVKNRNYLRRLYAVIKEFGGQIRFAFITGITMFSKVSLFSVLNNLNDISLDPRYSAICGYTEHDLENVFVRELEGLDRTEIRHWYNGYNWLGPEKVYNPWAILSLLDSRKFMAHWSETGMPSFLYKLMMERRFTPHNINNLKVEKNLVSTFDVDSIGIEALLFQSGYLTIIDEHRETADIVFELDYPNFEVRSSLNSGYLQHLFGMGKRVPTETKQMVSMLEQEDFDAFENKVRTLFAEIPHELHLNSDMAHYESWYCSVLHACLWDNAVKPYIRAQESTSRGRSDLVVVIGRKVFVFECKMAGRTDDSDQRALETIAQIKDRGYADKYRDGTNALYLIGAIFNEDKRNLLKMKVESN